VSLTIDANVWLSAADPREGHQEASAQFLAVVLGSTETLDSPLLLQVELVGALARKSGGSEDGLQLLKEVTSIPSQRWHPLDVELTSAACALAGELRLRGAEAVYVAVAAQAGSTFITLDREVQARAGRVIPVSTPALWMTSR
jgi:predicted nucleic acid-binding protein